MSQNDSFYKIKTTKKVFYLFHYCTRKLNGQPSGKVLSRMFGLKKRVTFIFFNKMIMISLIYSVIIYDVLTRFLLGMFIIFNNINTGIQGQKEHILNSTHKLLDFKKILHEKIKHKGV